MISLSKQIHVKLKTTLTQKYTIEKQYNLSKTNKKKYVKDLTNTILLKSKQ